MAKARLVADHIGTVHHEINYTIQEGLDAIRDVIYYIETYDITTVRASTPMYLLARVIKSMGIKMVLSGEGADEIFGGYLYFHKAPTAKDFHEETVRKLGKLYLYDCLRANKSLSAWGVEGRVPFLDKEFLDVAMRTNPEAKMCPGSTIEKKIVREAFADLLPDEVVWRQKEQFSDGVGYSWIDTLKDITSQAVSDEQMAHAAERFPINPPSRPQRSLRGQRGLQHRYRPRMGCRLPQHERPQWASRQGRASAEFEPRRVRGGLNRRGFPLLSSCVPSVASEQNSSEERLQVVHSFCRAVPRSVAVLQCCSCFSNRGKCQIEVLYLYIY